MTQNSFIVLEPLSYLVNTLYSKFVKDWIYLFYGFFLLSQTTWC